MYFSKFKESQLKNTYFYALNYELNLVYCNMFFLQSHQKNALFFIFVKSDNISHLKISLFLHFSTYGSTFISSQTAIFSSQI